MYGNKRRGPAPQPGQKPQSQQRPNKGTGHWWHDHYCPWYDYDYDYDYDWYDYDWNYDDWYDWVWTSAYEKGMGEGRKQGFAHAMNLANNSAPAPKPVAPSPAPAPAPMPANVAVDAGNVYPHTTTLGI